MLATHVRVYRGSVQRSEIILKDPEMDKSTIRFAREENSGLTINFAYLLYPSRVFEGFKKTVSFPDETCQGRRTF